MDPPERAQDVGQDILLHSLGDRLTRPTLRRRQVKTWIRVQDGFIYRGTLQGRRLCVGLYVV
jgi:hypothetical protein